MKGSAVSILQARWSTGNVRAVATHHYWWCVGQLPVMAQNTCLDVRIEAAQPPKPLESLVLFLEDTIVNDF